MTFGFEKLKCGNCGDVTTHHVITSMFVFDSTCDGKPMGACCPPIPMVCRKCGHASLDFEKRTSWRQKSILKKHDTLSIVQDKLSKQEASSDGYIDLPLETKYELALISCDKKRDPYTYYTLLKSASYASSDADVIKEFRERAVMSISAQIKKHGVYKKPRRQKMYPMPVDYLFMCDMLRELGYFDEARKQISLFINPLLASVRIYYKDGKNVTRFSDDDFDQILTVFYCLYAELQYIGSEDVSTKCIRDAQVLGRKKFEDFLAEQSVKI